MRTFRKGSGSILNSKVIKFDETVATLQVEQNGRREEQKTPYDHAFVLIGADVPREFLKSLGLRMENEWAGSVLRASALTLLGLLGAWIFGTSQGGHATFGSLDFSVFPVWTGLLIGGLGLAGLVRYGSKGDRFARWASMSWTLH